MAEAPRLESWVIDSAGLLRDCQALVRSLEADVAARVDANATLAAELMREHTTARSAERTRRSLEEWRRERVTQAAAAWVAPAGPHSSSSLGERIVDVYVLRRECLLHNLRSDIHAA